MGKNTKSQNLENKKSMSEGEALYRNVYNTAPLAFVIWDRDCIITDWNNHAEKLFGWPKKDVLGKNFFEVIIPDTAKSQVETIVENLLQGNLPSHSINENLTKEGKRILCEWNNSILYDDNRNIKGVISLALDITAAKKAEEDLKNAYDQLENIVKRRTDRLIKANERLKREIEERKLAEEALRKSEEKYRILFENVKDIVTLMDAEFKIRSISPSVEKILGYMPFELINKDITKLEIISPEYIETAGNDINQVFSGEHIDSSVYELYAKDGKRKFGEVSFAPLKRDGKIDAAICVVRDITNRKIAEKTIRESESQLRAILDASVDRIRYVDNDMKIIWANESSTHNFGRNVTDLIGQYCYEVYAGRDTPCDGCSCIMARETGKMEKAVLCKPKIDGKDEVSYWETYCVPLKNEKGEISNYLQVARDITDEKHAEDRIHSLTQQLIKAQENERQKISRELHDGIGANLSTMKIACEQFFGNLSDTSNEIRGKYLELSNTLQDTIDAVRNMAYDLRPPGLDQLGLVQTIYNFGVDFTSQAKLELDFFSAGLDGVKFDFDTEINLYRIVQEALNNVRKHSEASRVSIKLISSHPNIILRIEDDGKGFNLKKQRLAAQKEKRMGLISMEERINLLGGKMSINSKPMKGTKIVIEVPIQGGING